MYMVNLGGFRVLSIIWGKSVKQFMFETMRHLHLGLDANKRISNNHNSQTPGKRDEYLLIYQKQTRICGLVGFEFLTPALLCSLCSLLHNFIAAHCPTALEDP